MKRPQSPARFRLALRDYQLYLMVLPALVLFLIFSYAPMSGLVIAFKNYRIGQGMFGSNEWVGLANFQKLMGDLYFWRAFKNSLIIAAFRILISLPAAILLALLLNEVRSKPLKTIVQTAVYLPRFLSWIVVAIFAIMLLSAENGVNILLKGAGLPMVTLANPGQFRAIVVLTETWKETGFNSVLFTAAILAINPSLYESAKIDGANRFQLVWHITLPLIRNTIVVVLVLWVGVIINVGFDQVFNLYNASVYSSGDIIDTYIYRTAFAGAANKFSLAAAAGLFKSAIAIILLGASELFARSMGESALF